MATWENRSAAPDCGSAYKERTNAHILPYVDSATAPDNVKASLNTLPFERNVFKLLANNATSFPQFMALLSSIWHPDKKIRTSDWQIGVLRCAATLDAPYEWDVNEPVARILGFSAEQLAALQNPHEALPETLFKPRQRLIARFVEELNAGSRASPETMAEMRHTFSDAEIMELFYVVGVYSFLARMMNSCRIDFDEPIPGLMGMLEKYNAAAIEKEKTYED